MSDTETEAEAEIEARGGRRAGLAGPTSDAPVPTLGSAAGKVRCRCWPTRSTVAASARWRGSG